MVFRAANLIYNGQTDQAIQMLTTFSTGTYAQLVSDWLKYFQYLFVKYMDGNVKTPTSK